MIVALAAAAGRAIAGQTSVEEIRKELLQIPYDGVFDFIGFGYNKGTGGDKQLACTKARQVSGSFEVTNYFFSRLNAAVH